MGKQMRTEWVCDAPNCTQTEETVTADRYGTDWPPIGWSTLRLDVMQVDEECTCDCHDYDIDDDDEDEGNIHDEEECPTCPPESNHASSLCQRCTSAVRALYFANEKKKKGALL